MKIFDKNNQANQEELHLALSIGEKKVKSGIWTFKQKIGEVLAYGATETWGGISPEELIVAADASITSAITRLPEISGRQPSKVILGLPENWLEKNNIKESRTKILQAVCRKLLIKPLGFVVTSEAITHFLKKEEGDLVSVILISLEETEIIVSLVVQGKYLGSQVVARSNSLAMDLEEGLLRFEYDGVLPPRIILIDGESLEEAKQALISYPWVSPEKQKKITFLQLPKVDFAPDNLEIQAVVLAASRELDPKAELAMVSAKIPDKEVEPNKEVEPKVETVVEEEQQAPLPIAEPSMAEEFGFVMGKDISLEEGFGREEIELPISQTQFSQVPVAEEGLPEKEEAIPFSSLPEKKFKDKLLGIFRHVPKRSLKPSLEISRFIPKKGLVFFGLGLAAIAGIFILCYSKIVKAQVNLLVQPAVAEKEIEFSVSNKIDKPDLEKKLLPLYFLTSEESGSKTAEVKGRKIVGDKASGEVIIYNGTDKKRTITKGTLIVGPGDLKFSIEQEVSVPARSTDFNSSPPVDKWGEGKVAIAAKDIGAQYNIAANSTLSLEANTGTASAVIVRNPGEFTGGTSREISAVSKEDRDTLQGALQAELAAKSRASLEEKNPQTNLVSDSFKLKSKVDKFNHEVGDEAQELSLEEKAEFSIDFFKKEDVEAVVNKEIESSVPEGYKKEAFDQNQEIAGKDKSKGIYQIKIKYRFYPEVDVAKISSQIKGSLLPKTKKVLTGLRFVAGYEISVSPKIFSLLPMMPLKSKNITVDLKPI